MKDMYPRMLAVPGCDKVFLWVAMDEFEGGYTPTALRHKSGRCARRSGGHMGTHRGDRTWRKSAHTLQSLLKQ